VAVHIRLTRVGATRRPAYRVIAIDSRRSRDGRALEILGFYDPLTDPITVKLDDERIANWMARGALPSAAVQRLMKVAVAGPVPKRKPAPAAAEGAAAKPRRASRTKQPSLLLRRRKPRLRLRPTPWRKPPQKSRPPRRLRSRQ